MNELKTFCTNTHKHIYIHTHTTLTAETCILPNKHTHIHTHTHTHTLTHTHTHTHILSHCDDWFQTFQHVILGILPAFGAPVFIWLAVFPLLQCTAAQGGEDECRPASVWPDRLPPSC